MVERATSRQFINRSLLDRPTNQTFTDKQQHATGRKFAEGSGEQDPSNDRGKQPEVSTGHAGHEQLSHNGSGGEDEPKEGHASQESEDEEEEHHDTSNGDIHGRGEAENERNVRAKGKGGQLPLDLDFSKATAETHDAVLFDLGSTNVMFAPAERQTKSCTGGKVEEQLVAASELDQLLSAIQDGGGLRLKQEANSRRSRFLKGQERLWAQAVQLRAQKAKKRMSSLDDHSSDSDGSAVSTGREAKRQKSTEDRGIASVYSDSVGYKPETYLASSPSKRHCSESKPRAGLPASRPNPAALAPKRPQITSRSSLKKDKWSEEEDRALIELMVAQREYETNNKIPPNKWLKDVKLYAKISSQLAERGVFRSGNACKNQWNRATRQKSGFEERPDNGTTRSKICSEQRTKKEKEKRSRY